MDTQDFLRESILKMEGQLEKNRDSLRQIGEVLSDTRQRLSEDIAGVRQEVKVLETKVIAESRFHAVTWAIASAIVIKVLGAFFHGPSGN